MPALLPLLLLLAASSRAQDVQVRGIVEVDAPKPRGAVSFTVALHDSPEGGRRLWKSPLFVALAADWKWTFAGVGGPAGSVPTADFPDVVYVEFQSGNTVLKPRQPFHRAWGSAREKPIYDPGRAGAAAPAARSEAAPAGSNEPLEGPDGIELREDAKPALLQRAAPPLPPAPQAPRPAAREDSRSSGGERSLEDLRLSNDLYFQALREYRTEKVGLAIAKLEFALRLNPANTEARVTLERIRQERQIATAPLGATPSPEDVRAAQDLYFEALRHYGKGRLDRAHAALSRAATTDPSDRGIATALLRLKREMVLIPQGNDVVH